MPAERRPRETPPYPPVGGLARRVRLNESLVTIAREIATAQRRTYTWQNLAEFNFRTSVPEEVNWCLRNLVGCQHSVGDNYIFSNEDTPGIIYVPPAQSSVPDPPPPRPNPPRPRPHPATRDARDQCTTTVCRACPRIEEYIAAVVKAERIFPNLASNPAHMVTALRKTWNWGNYAGWTTWGQMLPDAETQALNLDTTRGRDSFSATERWLLQAVNCVQTPQHICTDLGHALAAVDATNFPRTRVPFLNTSAKVIAGCSWAGDLGSVYKAIWEWACRHPLDSRNEARIVQEFNSRWSELCANEDLLGDIDGVVLGSTFNRRQAFSRQLRTYYAARHTQANIFTAFPRVHSTSTSNVVALTWAWIQARTLGTYPRIEAMLNALATRFQQFVQQGQGGRVQNRCDSVRRRPIRRPSATPAPAPQPQPHDAGPPAGVQ